VVKKGDEETITWGIIIFNSVCGRHVFGCVIALVEKGDKAWFCFIPIWN